jgi:hypothetical protein
MGSFVRRGSMEPTIRADDKPTVERLGKCQLSSRSKRWACNARAGPIYNVGVFHLTTSVELGVSIGHPQARIQVPPLTRHLMPTSAATFSHAERLVAPTRHCSGGATRTDGR